MSEELYLKENEKLDVFLKELGATIDDNLRQAILAFCIQSWTETKKKGFVPYVFHSTNEVKLTIKNPKKLRQRKLAYMGRNIADTIKLQSFLDMMDEYDPSTSCVVLLAIKKKVLINANDSRLLAIKIIKNANPNLI